jgi:ribonuclease HII
LPKKKRPSPKRSYEQPHSLPAGVDEAGRGPLAGPVVAGACILPKGARLPGLNDSKKLTPAARDRLYDLLQSNPDIHCAVGIIDVATIDRINIFQATIQAMIEAVNALPLTPDFLLVDGLSLPHPIPSQKIIKGDELCRSIMAASILAKVTRDRIMLDFHARYPHYGFDSHKGYGTPQHLLALREHGRSPVHRLTFKGVRPQLGDLCVDLVVFDLLKEDVRFRKGRGKGSCECSVPVGKVSETEHRPQL